MKYYINQWTLMRGQDAQVCFHMLDEQGVCMQLTGITAVSLLLKNKDNSHLELAGAVGYTLGYFPSTWIYGFNLTGAQVDALPIGKIDAVIKMQFGTIERLATYHQSINVVKRPL